MLWRLKWHRLKVWIWSLWHQAARLIFHSLSQVVRRCLGSWLSSAISPLCGGWRSWVYYCTSILLGYSWVVIPLHLLVGIRDTRLLRFQLGKSLPRWVLTLRDRTPFVRGTRLDMGVVNILVWNTFEWAMVRFGADTRVSLTDPSHLLLMEYDVGYLRVEIIMSAINRCITLVLLLVLWVSQEHLVRFCGRWWLSQRHSSRLLTVAHLTLTSFVGDPSFLELFNGGIFVRLLKTSRWVLWQT